MKLPSEANRDVEGLTSMLLQMNLPKLLNVAKDNKFIMNPTSLNRIELTNKLILVLE